MKLNSCGKLVENEWLETAYIRTNTVLDEFIVMPNHIHAILIIDCPTFHRDVGAYCNTPLHRQAFQSPSESIGAIVRGFKGCVTNKLHTIGLHTFAWQRSYYDHVIRNEEDLLRIRQYIRYNPLKWGEDEYYNPNDLE